MLHKSNYSQNIGAVNKGPLPVSLQVVGNFIMVVTVHLMAS